MSSLDAVRRHLEARDEILFAYLFGSRAGGRPRPDSDWDVAIFVRPTLSGRKRFDLRVQLGLDLEEVGRADVCVLNDAPPLLAQSALKGRRLVVRDKTALVRFFVKTMALVDDARWWSEIHLKARLRRIEEGRFGRP
ncbi:MAG: nucleotidyltransferase domain-containing protein [bacterium]|nr:nucleotidyltransferase domain-containing protein [bacterium]